jgi:multiple sugar transport system permease protein
VKKVLFWLAILFLLFCVLAPFYWMVVSSISYQAELALRPPHWFPEEVTFSRYQQIFEGFRTGFADNSPAAKFTRGLSNSFTVAGLTTLICMVAGCMAAFALTRLGIPHGRTLMMIILGSQMLPAIVIIIPINLLLQKYHMIDTIQGLVLPYCGLMLPTVTWIMYGYFLSIPREMEEAAMIDGCTKLQSFLKVVLPVSGPGLVAVTAYTFLYSWNEFFMALTLTQTNTKTITVTITEFASLFGTDYGLLATGGVIGSIPPLIVAFLLQRYLVAGLTAGSVKG